MGAINIPIDVNVVTKGEKALKAAIESFENLNRVLQEQTTRTEKVKASLAALGKTYDALQDPLEKAQKAWSSDKEGLGLLIDEYNKYNTAVSKAATIAMKSEEDMAKLRKQVSALSQTIPMAREELANGLYQVISNGVPENNWIAFLEQSSKAAVGGLADVTEIVKVTSTMIKNYGLKWDQAQAIQDRMQMTCRNGVTSFNDLAASLPSVAGNAATLGISIDELLASFATLTGVSGNTSEVATQLAAVMSALIKPSSEAANMAEAMGFAFDAASVKAAGGFQNFLKDLDNAVNAYSQKTGMQAQSIYSTLFGSEEALKALIPINGELAQKFCENVGAMEQSTGSLQTAFNEMGGTVEATQQKFVNMFAYWADGAMSMVSYGTKILDIAIYLGEVTTALVTLTKAVYAISVAVKVLNISLKSIIATLSIAGAAIAGLLTLWDWYQESIAESTNSTDNLTASQKKLQAQAKKTAQEQQAAAAKFKASEAAKKTKSKVAKVSKEDQKKKKEHSQLELDIEKAKKEYEKALNDSQATVDTKLELATNLANLQAQLDTLTKGELTIKAAVEPDYIKKGSIQDKEKSYDNASSQISRVQTQYQNEIIDYDTAKKQIDDINEQLKQLGVKPVEVEIYAKGSIQDKEKSYDNASNKASNVQSLYDKGLISKDDAQKEINAINEELKQLGDGVKPIKLEIDTEGTKDVKKVFGTMQDGWGTIEQTVSGFENLTDAIENGGNAWEQISGVMNAFFQIAEGITSIVQGVVSIIQALSVATKEQTSAQEQQNIAQITGTAATIAQATASGAAAATETAETIATEANAKAKGSEAIANATSSGAKMPFPYNLIAISTGVAAVIAALTSCFATGGIVPGASTTGDKVIARVNSGEMILNKQQQANLFKMINAGFAPATSMQPITMPNIELNTAALNSNLRSPDDYYKNVVFKQQGRDLIGVIQIEKNFARKSGRIYNLG